MRLGLIHFAETTELKLNKKGSMEPMNPLAFSLINTQHIIFKNSENGNGEYAAETIDKSSSPNSPSSNWLIKADRSSSVLENEFSAAMTLRIEIIS